MAKQTNRKLEVEVESVGIKPAEVAAAMANDEVKQAEPIAKPAVVETAVWLMWNGEAQYAETTTPEAWEKVGWKRVTK